MDEDGSVRGRRRGSPADGDGDSGEVDGGVLAGFCLIRHVHRVTTIMTVSEIPSVMAVVVSIGDDEDFTSSGSGDEIRASCSTVFKTKRSGRCEN